MRIESWRSQFSKEDELVREGVCCDHWDARRLLEEADRRIGGFDHQGCHGDFEVRRDYTGDIEVRQLP